MRPNRRGESLVEVLVAISIFMLVFAGVVSMVAGSVTLNLSSRQRTEAVAKAQKYLNQDVAARISPSVCSVGAVGWPVGHIEIYESMINGVAGTNANCKATGGLNTSGDYCYWTEVSDLTDVTETNSALGLKAPTFIKIVSHAKWYTRILGEQSFQIDRIVRVAK